MKDKVLWLARPPSAYAGVDERLATPGLDSRRLDCGRGGKIVEIRFADMQRVGACLGKYLTKEVSLGIKRARRVTSSRDISPFVKGEKEGERELRPVPIEALYKLWEKLSEDVSLSRDGVLLSFEVGVT